MKRVWNSFLIAFAMFSRIPVPQADWDEQNMKYMMCFFPAVGVVSGLLVIGFDRLSLFLSLGGTARAAGFVLLPVLVSGGIHMDGFLDTADALSSHQPAEKKLAILKDSHAGAFAVLAGCCYFVLAVGVWSEIGSESVPLLALSFPLSRALSSLALSVFPKANKSGSLSRFSDAAKKRVLLFVLALWIAGIALLALLYDLPRGLLLLGMQALCYLWYYRIAMKQFGGTTGDIAGFFVQVSELACAFAVMLGGKIL